MVNTHNKLPSTIERWKLRYNMAVLIETGKYLSFKYIEVSFVFLPKLLW